jgi:hypothetical protein
MTTTNHISPSGGQSERPKDDAISRSKRILELIDIYVERPDRMNRNALRSHLFDEFTEAAGIAQTGEDAANGAIGEREAFGSIHEFLGIASKRLYPTPDKPNSEHSGQSFYGSVGDLASSPRRIHAIHGNATSTDTGGADARAHQENRRRAFLGRQMYDGR